MREPGSRVAMIGIDAADLGFIEAHRNSLPHLRRALDSGIRRPLRSTAEFLTGSVWPTFYTGKTPGEHGIYHHLQWDSGAMRLRRVTEEWLYCEPFWLELERRGHRVVAIDVPMTFAPRLKRGIEVITWGAHDELTPFATSPRSLAGEARKRFGKHPMGSEIPVSKSRRALEDIRKNLVEGAKRKGELCAWLLRQQAWDFLIAVFGECHRGGHILWPGGEGVPESALLDVYRAVDAAVGAVMEILRTASAHIYLFALHGMGPNRSQEHFVPAVMQVANRRFTSATSLAPERGPRGFSPVRWLREHVPAGVQNAVARAVPVGLRDEVVNRATTGGYDWERTPGFPLLGDYNGYMRLNLRGREARGLLDHDSKSMFDYQQVVENVFRSFRFTTTQEPVVRDIRYSARDFPGRRTTYLPDMIVTWADALPQTTVVSPEYGRVSAELSTGRSGNHRPDGFCVELPADSEPAASADPLPIWQLARLASAKLEPESASASAR